MDEHNNSYNYKYTFAVEIAPICANDLLLLPPDLSKSLGGIGPLVLVYKVTDSIHIVDP
jgi:nonsense-mediated mRNA decay protein 3